MNESHFNEIEKVMLFISEARERAEKASKAIEKDGGELHHHAPTNRQLPQPNTSSSAPLLGRPLDRMLRR